MNNTLLNLLDVCVIVYLNDIPIYLDNMSQYWEKTKEVLHKLHKASLNTEAEKYEFYSDSIEYLGYILSP